ncbi:hypothetical protein HanLR1_Chr05g0171591 [Helianthus annuus]|nr:hypothetical protein HanLR1_Chr05g0171591 [Helianthus annuus]
MSLFWQMDWEDKPVYMEDGKSKIWDFLTFLSLRLFFFVNLLLFSLLQLSLYTLSRSREREGGKMATIPKRADEELWYLQIVKNFSLSRDEDLAAQPPTGAGLTPVVVKRPKAKPRDTADIPASNPEDPIDLESSPEPLLKTKTGKRKQVETEAEAQPAKKIPRRKINKRSNLDAFIVKPPPDDCLQKETPAAIAEPSSIVNADLPPSTPRAPISEQPEGSKAVGDEAEKVAKVENPEVEKSADVESEKVVDPESAEVDATRHKSSEVVARDLEKGKSVPEDPMITIPASSTTSAPVNS